MTDVVKSIGLGPELLEYVIDRSGGRDPIATELARVTRERLGDLAGMNIEQDQGRLMEMLVRVTGASTVIEVGTFTGMSALFLARGLPAGGRLICFDIDESYVDIGRPFWEQAGVADRIEVRIGAAAESLAATPTEPWIDMAFIDADKGGYAQYLDLVLERLAPRGVVLIDNVLWSGNVIDMSDQSEATRHIRAFNDRVAADATLQSVMIGVGDGLTMIRRR